MFYDICVTAHSDTDPVVKVSLFHRTFNSLVFKKTYLYIIVVVVVVVVVVMRVYRIRIVDKSSNY